MLRRLDLREKQERLQELLASMRAVVQGEDSQGRWVFDRVARRSGAISVTPGRSTRHAIARPRPKQISGRSSGRQPNWNIR